MTRNGQNSRPAETDPYGAYISAARAIWPCFLEFCGPTVGRILFWSEYRHAGCRNTLLIQHYFSALGITQLEKTVVLRSAFAFAAIICAPTKYRIVHRHFIYYLSS